MRASLQVSVIILAFLCQVASAHGDERPAAPPNLLVFLSDDQGWGDFSLHGNPHLKTPHIDSLARDGARCEWFYVSPVCSPTRAEFLTGRYHVRGGVHSTSTGGERLDLDEATIAESFQAAGYATAAFGKWHNGTQFPYHPRARGFDEYYGFTSGHWGHYYSPLLDHNGRLVKGEGYLTDDFTQRAIDFIQQHRDRPWFVYVPFNTPHSPMQVPDRWWDKHKDNDELDPHTRAAYAMCENIDWNVGRVLARLEELEIAENTIVLYFCDNGPNGRRFNGGMRGIKGSVDEGGVRSPLFVRWPAQIKSDTVVAQPCAAIDLFPTLADLCGVKVAARQPLDGLSLKPLLIGEGIDSDATGEPFAERILFSHWNGNISARWRNYRLDQQGRLYDLARDLPQSKDVAASQPEIAQRLRAAVSAWRKDVLGELDPTPQPFTVGHDDSFPTQLPARDAQFTGGIRRSNRHPNCTYLLNWRTVDDRITFDIDVASAGDYDVEIHYACAEANVGAMVETSCGDQRLTGQITEAHDPPLLGASDDRVPRGEGYVKDFRPLRLGAISLKVGRGLLTLSATEVPGKEVMEFRLLALTRVK